MKCSAPADEDALSVTPAGWVESDGDILEELPASTKRRDGRVAEGARLESVYTARYPGFESLSLRHFPFLNPQKSFGYQRLFFALKSISNETSRSQRWAPGWSGLTSSGVT